MLIDTHIHIHIDVHIHRYTCKPKCRRWPAAARLHAAGPGHTLCSVGCSYYITVCLYYTRLDCIHIGLYYYIMFY